MNSTARNSGLRRGIFAAGLAATAIAAALSPDWSSVLKAQGYYGSVDLSIDAELGEEALLPGQDVVVVVDVANLGPDAANRVRTIARAHNMNLVHGAGCSGGMHYPQCALADSLDAGSNRSYSLYMRVPPDARHHVQFSASVTSDDTEIQPGDEIVLLKRPIRVPVDFDTEIACARVRQGVAAERVAHCSIRFRSLGIFGAREPTLQATAALAGPLPVRWSCESTPAGLCASAQANGNSYSVRPALMPGQASVTFFAELPLRGAPPVIAFNAGAALNPLMGETESNPANNAASLEFEPSLFFDGFDPLQ